MTYHPELVSIVADKNGPMLGRVWIVSRLLGNHLAQPRLFSKPFAGEAANRMPADFNGPGRAVNDGLGDGNGIGNMAQPHGMLQGQFAFGEILLPGGEG